MIEVSNLNFSYTNNAILKNINLKFEKGKFYSVIGPNGSGKTTLINILSRLLKPKHCSLIIEGKDYSTYKQKNFSKLVSLLPQTHTVPDMTVSQLVSCGRFPFQNFTRKLSEYDYEAINIALKKTNTISLADKKLKNISGGEVQKAYIAMLLAWNAPYVLLDEPTTYLDIAVSYETIKLLDDMKNSNKCIISVMYDLNLAFKYADEIVIMQNGVVIDVNTPEKIADSNILNKVFGIECTKINLNGKLHYCF